MTLLLFGLAGILFTVFSFLSLTHPLGVSVIQAQTILTSLTTSVPALLIHQPFPIYSLLTRVWFSLFPTGEFTLRLLGLFLLLIALPSIYRALSAYLPKSIRPWIPLIILTFPGILVLTSDYHPELLSLIFFTLTLSSSPRRSGLFLTLLALTSLTGLIAAVVYAVLGLKKTPLYLLFLAASFFWLFFHREVIFPGWPSDLIRNTTPSRLSQEINSQQKIFFLAAGKSAFLPAPWPKLLFNKPEFALQLWLRRTAEIFDPTLWTAPLSGWMITGLSGLPPKGVWPLISYWQLPIILFGLFAPGVLWLWLPGLLPVLLQNSAQINSAASILLLPFYLTFLRTVSVILPRHRLAGPALFILSLLSFIYFQSAWFFHAQDSRPSPILAYRRLFDNYQQLQSRYPRFVITTSLGPSDLLFRFYAGRDIPNVEFTPVDWRTRPTSGGKIYMAFAPEFTGSADPESLIRLPQSRVVGRISLPDEIIYHFGPVIWLVERL